MKKRFKVLWSQAAEDDLLHIVEYIAEDNVAAARKTFAAIRKKAENLFFSPERGRIVPEFKAHGILQYRELVAAPWRLIYRIADNAVYIFAVLDSRQNIEDVLLRRLTSPKR